jgi:hypothetical protein
MRGLAGDVAAYALVLTLFAPVLLAQKIADHPAIDYRQPRTCVTCHPNQARLQPETGMAHAMETIAECNILRQHPLLTLRLDQYSYRLERKGDTTIYTVTNGIETFSVPLGWALGLGTAGQTYVFEHAGAMYESRVSFYKAVDGLDLTIGAQKIHPTTILEAAGRQVGEREARLCFGCHTTNSLDADKINTDRLVPGVQCEHCHGPTENHLEGLKKVDMTLFAMKKLGALKAE